MKALGLPVGSARAAGIGSLVPVEAEPPQVAQDGLLGLARRALDIRVLDAQDERPAGSAREQPVEQRGSRVADVELTGRAWGETEAHWRSFRVQGSGFRVQGSRFKVQGSTGRRRGRR